MMILNDDICLSIYLQEKLVEIVGNSLKKGISTWIFRCPVCGDSKKNKKKRRGTFYLKTNTYYCFNEGCYGKGLYIISLFTKIPLNEVKKDYLHWKNKYLNLNNNINDTNNLKLNFNDNNYNNDNNNNNFQIPNYWIDLNEDCLRFIKSRKIDQAPFKPKNWKLYFNCKSRRLVLPWIYNNKIIYYQERALYKGQEPKYLFPSNLNKGIFGLDNIDNNCPYIFYTEGCLDAIWSYNTIAIGGLMLTNNQKQLLNEKYSNFKLIWLPDNPWQDKTVCEKILKLKENILMFKWDNNIKVKDINDYILINNKNIFENKDYLINNIITSDKMKVLLKLKKLII